MNGVTETKRKEWYNEHKNQNIQIVEWTYYDRDSGRLTTEVFSEGLDLPRALAHGVYHPIFEIIRETAPERFAEIQRWHAQRTGFSGQSIDEAFAKENWKRVKLYDKENKAIGFVIDAWTRFDPSTGRIKITFYGDAFSSRRIAAEEVYHAIYEVIRFSSPETHRLIKEWYKKYYAGSGQEIDEAFVGIGIVGDGEKNRRILTLLNNYKAL